MNYRSKNCSLALHSHYVIGAWIFVSIRFSQRLLLLDEPRDAFLRTLLYLGGYCTIEQAQKLGLANSATRVVAHLEALKKIGRASCRERGERWEAGPAARTKRR